MTSDAEPENSRSNRAAQATWTRRPVGSQRSACEPGEPEYFEDLRRYRYGYETPFIHSFFEFGDLRGKRVLEIGVGNGIDAVEMLKAGALYSGVDVTSRHLELAGKNIEQHGFRPQHLWCADLLQLAPSERFDVVYSFGVLHHIAHEAAYLRKIRALLAPGGRLLFAVYSKYSFFNVYLLVSWVAKARMRVPLDNWRSHVAELSELHHPVTIKIRSRRQVEQLLSNAGFRVVRYSKRGFVQRYIPLLGRLCSPDGWVLTSLGAMLGWYHLFECVPAQPVNDVPEHS